MSVVMLNETPRSMPVAAETLYVVSGILLPKSGVWRECHGTVAQIAGWSWQNVGRRIFTLISPAAIAIVQQSAEKANCFPCSQITRPSWLLLLHRR